MSEPSKEALKIIAKARRFRCWHKTPTSTTDKPGDIGGIEYIEDWPTAALAIDALCAERVKEALGEVRDTATIVYMSAHADSAEMIRSLTAQRDRLKEALEEILIYATVRGMDYEPSNIAVVALKEVEG